jgi:hypothetical protein
MFDIEKAVREWKQGLRKLESFEDGYIAELESHLRDEIDRQKGLALNDEAAFTKAVSLIGRPESIGAEYFKSNAGILTPAPAWTHSRFSPVALAWNGLKIALRTIRRQKGYSFINIAGMSLGLTGFILIATYVRHELSYDKFHEKSDRLYRVIAESREPRGTTRMAPTPAPWAPALQEEYPEIEKVVRVYFLGEGLLTAGDKRFYENRIIFAEPDFFDVFSFPVVRGDPASLLRNPQSIVLTESAARKYFGAADPLGKALFLNKSHEFLVTGVVRDVPQNSHFHFDFVASFAAPVEDICGFDLDQWYAYFVGTYVLTRPGFSPRAFEEKTKNFASVHAPRTDGIAVRPLLQPLAAIHLDTGTARDVEPGVSPTSLMVILLIGLFILAIAAINFVNMSLARAFRRIKEVGIRKVTGASRGRLTLQFLLESLLQIYLGLVLALFLVALVQPFFAGLPRCSSSRIPSSAGARRRLISGPPSVPPGTHPHDEERDGFRPEEAADLGLAQYPGRRPVRHFRVPHHRNHPDPETAPPYDHGRYGFSTGQSDPHSSP